MALAFYLGICDKYARRGRQHKGGEYELALVTLPGIVGDYM